MKQLEALIEGMAPTDRDQAASAISFVIGLLQKYPKNLTAGAFLKFMSSLGIYAGMNSMPKFWAKVRHKSAKIGPHVTAVFRTF